MINESFAVRVKIQGRNNYNYVTGTAFDEKTSELMYLFGDIEKAIMYKMSKAFQISKEICKNNPFVKEARVLRK